MSTLEGLDIGYELAHPGTLAVRPDGAAIRLVSGLILRRVAAGAATQISEGSR
ncbi:hypothetical protein HCB18_27190 [Salinispora arenicola]|nr:hypothetical protein [Salinispora arenicola]